MRAGVTAGISRGHWLLNALAAAVAPFLTLSTLVLFTRKVIPTTDWDVAILWLSVMVGCLFLLRLPVAWWVRLLFCLVYVPLCFFAVVFYGLHFVCYAFGECV